MSGPGWSAVIVGVEALRFGGWTPQIAWEWDIVFDADDHVVIPARIRIRRTSRPARWFADVSPGIIPPDMTGDMRRLRPAWALADLLAHERCPDRPGLFAGLNPDDIQPIGLTSADRADWRAACAVFGLDSDAEARWLRDGGSTAELVGRQTE